MLENTVFSSNKEVAIVYNAKKGSVENAWGKGFTKRCLFTSSTCREGCKYVRLRWAKLAPISPVLFWIREKGGETHHIRVTVAYGKFLQSQ